MGINVSKKDAGFPINLYFSLMLLSFIPFIYTLVRTNLIADVPLTDGLGIAGHIEWFDLINETIQAFLIVPLFGLFNKCVQGTRDFKERAFQLFLIANGIYILFSAIIFVRCKFIVSVMTADQTYEVTKYLQLETIGFIVANAVSFANVLFVVLGKTAYIYAIIVLKTVLTIFGDLFWIPQFGVNGIAYSNIAVSSACNTSKVIKMDLNHLRPAVLGEPTCTKAQNLVCTRNPSGCRVNGESDFRVGDALQHTGKLLLRFLDFRDVFEAVRKRLSPLTRCHVPQKFGVLLPELFRGGRVAPCAGAWVESQIIFITPIGISVAPCAGAWVESARV